MAENDTVELATELTVAWLSNPSTRASVGDVKAFLTSMNAAVADLAAPPPPAVEDATKTFEPAVSVRKSLANPDFIVSMIDGKPYKTLRRHLSTRGLTPDEYRARYNLKPDYPIVAASYSEARKAMAKKIGLGRKPGQKVAPKQASDEPKSGGRAKSGRKSVAEAKRAAQEHLSGSK